MGYTSSLRMISALSAMISVIVLSTRATSWGWGETWEEIELLSGRGPCDNIVEACEAARVQMGRGWVNRPQRLILVYVQLELALYGCGNEYVSHDRVASPWPMRIKVHKTQVTSYGNTWFPTGMYLEASDTALIRAAWIVFSRPWACSSACFLPYTLLACDSFLVFTFAGWSSYNDRLSGHQ